MALEWGGAHYHLTKSSFDDIRVENISMVAEMWEMIKAATIINIYHKLYRIYFILNIIHMHYVGLKKSCFDV